MYPNPHGPGCPWYSLAESQGAPNIKWCEETLCQWISEPSNTWSNLGYLLTGLIVTFLAFRNKEQFHLKLYGPIVFIMGVTSFFYHMSNFYGSQILDFVGMFFFVGWAIGMNLIRRKKLKNLVLFMGVFTIVNVIIMHFMYLMEMKFQLLILLSAFVIIATEFKRTSFWFLLTLMFLLVAFGFSLSDAERYWCDSSEHVIQGHALWHLLASIATFTLYKHYSTLRQY